LLFAAALIFLVGGKAGVESALSPLAGAQTLIAGSPQLIIAIMATPLGAKAAVYAGNHDGGAVLAAYQHAHGISPMSRPLALPEKQALRFHAIESAFSRLEDMNRSSGCPLAWA
jgi:hypothetical protein